MNAKKYQFQIPSLILPSLVDLKFTQKSSFSFCFCFVFVFVASGGVAVSDQW
jgi:hypothetical protein